MFKGTKKAIARTPHLLLGQKSAEDELVVRWTKDFTTADEAVSQIVRETKNYIQSWRNVCGAQLQIACQFRELYEPIGEENVYGSVRDQTSKSTLPAVVQYQELTSGKANNSKSPLKSIESYLLYLEVPFLSKLEEVKKCLNGIQKLMTKCKHKKIDIDRHYNDLEKLKQKLPSQNEVANFKDQLAVTKKEHELEQATGQFQYYDEKVKATVPQFLAYMSEFLNLITKLLFIAQLGIVETLERDYVEYSQTSGLSGSLFVSSNLITEYVDNSLRLVINGEPDDYVSIVDRWEERHVEVEQAYEQAIYFIQGNEAVRNHSDHHTSRKDHVTKQAQKTFNKGVNLTSGLVHKAIKKLPHHYVNDIKFSSLEYGFFEKKADISMVHREGILPPSPPSDAAKSPISLASIKSFPFFHKPVSATRPAFSSFPFSKNIHPVELFPKTLNETRQSGPYGRCPITCVFRPAESSTDRERLPQTRVRASMSSSAWQSNESQILPSNNNHVKNVPSNVYEKANSIVPNRFIARENDKAVALFTFKGEEPGDVAFRAGEEIDVLDHGDQTDQNWWFGRTFDGRVGLFPRSYVNVLTS